MDRVKIDNFVRENPDLEFPSITPLGAVETEKIRQMLASRLEIEDPTGLALVNCVDSLGRPVVGVAADQHGFSVLEVLASLGLSFSEYVYINWYRYDQIDAVRLQDLDKHFSDFWYPSVDDMDLFDTSLKWILSVSHFGQLKLLQFIEK